MKRFRKFCADLHQLAHPGEPHPAPPVGRGRKLYSVAVLAAAAAAWALAIWSMVR